MIENFTNHAANERTYLAWIRTAIAIMALGFVIEKFDLFLVYLSRRIGAGETPSSSAQAEIVGLVLILLSLGILLGATVRFLLLKRRIDDPAPKAYASSLTNVILALLLTLLCVFVLVFLYHQIAL
ncbi:MAG: DUF202 domain-containing protein [Gammaproteobacteria bacterium]|jgi:putative membrane protein|nr:DUF202 domain-containing protein [Gammaproteobacteria bacterium]